jgi:hypothetical protein
MPVNRIDLQEGFTGDTVTVRVNGKEIFHEAGVKTRLQSGFARIIPLESAHEAAAIEIRLAERKLAGKFDIDAPGSVCVGVSVDPGGKFSHKVSAQPFGYV